MLMSNTARPARLHYMANNFRVLTPGDHVTCAISGDAIPIETLFSARSASKPAIRRCDAGDRATRFCISDLDEL